MQLIDDLVKDMSLLLNVIHHKGSAQTDYNDQLDIIYIDNYGEKKLHSIENPKMEVFFAKDHAKKEGYNRYYIKKEDAYPVEVEFRNAAIEIAKEIGEDATKYVFDLIKAGKRSQIENIHKDPNVFASDYRIEEWYRIQFAIGLNKKYAGKERPIYTIKKSYLDIEVDGIDYPGFVEGGIAPINAVTLIDQDTMTSRTFLLRNEKNPQIQEFEDDIDSFIQELHDDFDETYGRLTYDIFMYDEKDELEMVQDIFSVLHATSPDFVLIWNASFDIPYIVDRISQLGGNPAEIMTDDEFPVKEAWFYKDKRNFAVANKGDYTKLSAKFAVLDQMIIYGGLRKAQSEIRSFKLNDVGKNEVKDEKLDYGEVSSFKTFPYENYRLFVKYNIKDVLLQLGIEKKTMDLDNLMTRASSNATSFEKIFKQTVFLRSRAYMEWDRQGLIICNNQNVTHGFFDSVNLNVKKDKDTEEESYAGGIVADPLLNEHVGIRIMGALSKFIHEYVIDFDFKSMYPYATIAHNIAPNTIIGKIYIKADGGEMYAKFVSATSIDEIMESEDLGADFLNDVQVADPIRLANRWFGLPTVDQAMEHVLRKCVEDDDDELNAA